MTVCDLVAARYWGKADALKWVGVLMDLHESDASDEELLAHWDTIPVHHRPQMRRHMEKFLEGLA